MLQRMRELAVQSANASNNTSDRTALQAEVTQLRSEIDRVAKTTSFNNQKILDGSFAGGVFQVGAGAGDNITAGGITNAKMTALGSSTYGASKFTGQTSNITDFAKATEELTIKVDGVEHKLGKLGVANSETERLGQTVAAINAKTADTGVTAFLEQGANGSFSVSLRSTSEGAVELGAGFTAASTGVAGAVTVSDIDRAAGAFKDLEDAIAAVVDDTAELTVGEAKAINDALRALSKDPVLGQFASQWADAAGEIKAQTGDVSGILGDLTTAVTGVADAYDAAVAAKDAFELVGDAATVADIDTYATALKALNPGGSDFDFADADDLAVAKEALSKLAQSVGFSGLNIEQAGQTKGIDKLDISTQAGAWEAIKQIDSAIDQVNSARGDLQPASGSGEPERLAQPHHGCRLRPGNRQPEPRADPAASGHGHGGTGQPAAPASVEPAALSGAQGGGGVQALLSPG
jgi:flagellin-like hook-associated protein FlgL